MTRIQKPTLTVVLTILFASNVPEAANADQYYYAVGSYTYQIEYLDLTGQPTGQSLGSDVPTALSVDIEDNDYTTVSFGALSLQGFAVLSVVDSTDFYGTITENDYPGPDISVNFDVVGGAPVVADYSSEGFYGSYYEYEYASFSPVPEPSSIWLATTGVLIVSALMLTRSFYDRKVRASTGPADLSLRATG